MTSGSKRDEDSHVTSERVRARDAARTRNEVQGIVESLDEWTSTDEGDICAREETLAVKLK